MICCECSHVVRVMRRDDAAAQPDRRSDDERVNRHLASRVRVGKDVPGDSRDARSGRDHLCESSGEDGVDGFVCSAASIEFDQYRSGDTDWEVPFVCAAHGCSDALVAFRVLGGTRECGECLAVEN